MKHVKLFKLDNGNLSEQIQKQQEDQYQRIKDITE